MAADAGELKARATLDNTEFLSALKEMVQSVQTQAQAASDKLDSMTGSLKALGEAALAIGIVDKIKDIGAEALATAEQMAKLKAGFEAVNGATEETNRVFNDLKELGLRSVFDFEDVLGPAAKNMILLGTSAEQTEKTMTALVDAASGLKQGPDWINNVSDTLARMQSHLIVTARDMKALTAEGVDAWGALADQIGVSVSRAQEMVKKGMVTAQQVTEAVTNELQDRFKGAADLAGNTWVGAMKIFEASSKEAKEAVGETVLKVLNDFAPALDAISKGIQALTEWWKGLSEPVQNAVVAFSAALVVVGGLAAVWPLLVAGFAAIIAPLGLVTLAIAAAVAALALIGKWVYDNWPAIKAVFLTIWDDIKDYWEHRWNDITSFFTAIWDGIASAATAIWTPIKELLTALWDGLSSAWQTTWSAISGFFTSTFGGLASFLTNLWNGVKSTVGAAIDWLATKFGDLITWAGKITGAIGNFFANLPGEQYLKKLGAAWDQGQQQIAATAAATAAHTKAIQDNTTETTKNVQARNQEQAAELAAANAAKQREAAAKKAQEEAKKEAEEEKKYAEGVRNGYELLAKVAPDVAKQIADSLGGLSEDTTKVAKAFGTAWDYMSDENKKLAQETLKLVEAFKTLGVGATTELQATATKAEAAYALIASSGKASTADLASAFEAVVAAQQKLADHTNNELKKAFDSGAIDADTYYQGIVDNAQKAVDAAIAAWNQGLATETDVQVKEKILNDDRVAQQKNLAAEYTTAIHAIGEKTAEELTIAATQWQKYADAIGQKLGTDSKQYLEAEVQRIQTLIDKYKTLGQPIPSTLKDSLEDAKQALEDLKDPAVKLAEDFKALGVATMQSQIDSINTLSAALADAKDNIDNTTASQVNLTLAGDALDKQTQKTVDLMNTQWVDAFHKGDITAQELAQHTVESAKQIQQQLSTTSADGTVDIEAVNSAARVLDASMKHLAEVQLAATNKAFTDLGVNSSAQMKKMADDAAADFAIVAQSANENGTTYMNAWINAHQKIYDQLTAEGTSLSSAQKEDMAKMVAKRDSFLEDQKSAWATAYNSIKTTIGTAFDDLTKAIVTGDQSFGQLMTKMWQSLAEAALNAFLAPVKKAISEFIANELANLLGDKGFGGILSSIKSIGGAWDEVFKGGGPLNTTGPQLPSDIATGVDDAAKGASDAAGSAAGAAGAIAGGVTGIIGAVGSIGTMITGAINDIQTAHTNTLLGRIEISTRYAEMYLGGRADQGILGVLFRILDEVSFGHTTKAVEGLRNDFESWAPQVLTILGDMHDYVVSISAYVTDSRWILGDIRDIANRLEGAVTTGFQNLQVTINAGNLTTADAARQLGNQIAQNLSTQLTAIRGT
jgi:tape measure domain-containing protein